MKFVQRRFDVGQMLHQAPDAERADRARGPGLLVAQPGRGVPQQVAPVVQGFDQQVVLDGHGGLPSMASARL
jgi:hypothetical protein